MKKDTVQKPTTNEGGGNQPTDNAEWRASTNDEVYEFLDNLDFLKHIDVTEYEREVLGSNNKRNAESDEIAINVDFLEDLAFFDELDYFEQLNKSLEQELRELDSKLRLSPISGVKRWVRRHANLLLIAASVGATTIVGVTALTVVGKYLSGSDVSYASTQGYNQNNNNQVAAAQTATPKPEKTKDAASTPDGALVSSDIPFVEGEENTVHKSESLIPKQSSAPVDEQEDPQQKTPITVREVSDEELEEFFNGSAFMGNSLTVGLQLSGGLSSAKFIAAKSMNVADALSKDVIEHGGTKETMIEALKDTDCDTIYLMFGVNELGWPSVSTFGSRYEDLISKIKEVKPDATIYVQSILPITKSRSNKGDCFTKENIDKFNKEIEQSAKNQGVNYLDISAGLAEEDGYLPEEASTDGIHLKRTYYQKWLSYIYCSLQ